MRIVVEVRPEAAAGFTRFAPGGATTVVSVFRLLVAGVDSTEWAGMTTVSVEAPGPEGS